MRDLLGLAPIVRVIDFENTSLDPDAEVAEVGWCDLDPVSHVVGDGGSYLCRVQSMPPDTRAVHHIRLSDCEPFPRYDKRVLFEEAVRANVVAFAAHNAEHEAKFLCGDIQIVCSYKSALRIWPEAPSHGLFALLYYLEDRGIVSYDSVRAYPQHRAGPDAYVTAVIMSAMYQAGYTGKDFRGWTVEPAMLPRCPLGQWRGHKWEDVDDGFLEWIIRTIRDRDDVVFCAQRELDRREPRDGQ